MFNIKKNTTQDMINKLHQLKGKTKIKFHQHVSTFLDEINIRRQCGTFHFEEGTFSENAEVISKIYQEVFLLLKFSQTKPSIRSMKINSFDSYYTLLKREMIKKL